MSVTLARNNAVYITALQFEDIRTSYLYGYLVHLYLYLLSVVSHNDLLLFFYPCTALSWYDML